MLFQKKVDRAMEYSAKRAAEQSKREEEYDPKAMREQESIGEVMEKGDLAAIILSAMLVFLPIALIVLLIICFFGALPLIF